MKLLITSQSKRVAIDITNEIEQYLPPRNGLTHIYAQHTTCAVTTLDIDPGMTEDFMDAISDLLPEKQWRHPHDNSYEHVSAHILGSIIGPSVSVPFQNGRLQLGTWQRVFLIELDGPRERKLIISITPDEV